MRKRTAVTQHFTVLSTFQEAGKLIKGSQWAILAPLLVFILLSSGLFLIFGYIFNQMSLTDASSHSTWVIAYSLASLFLFLVTCLFLCALAGIIKVAIRRARIPTNVPVKVGFQGFSRFIPLFFTAVFIALFLIVPILLIAIPIFIYLSYALIISVFFCLSVPLAADKTSSPFCALIHSAQITSPHFLKILCIFMILIGIYLLACIPLGLGFYFHSQIISLLGGLILLLTLLWLIPLKYLLLGVIYHKLVG